MARCTTAALETLAPAGLTVTILARSHSDASPPLHACETNKNSPQPSQRSFTTLPTIQRRACCASQHSNAHNTHLYLMTPEGTKCNRLIQPLHHQFNLCLKIGAWYTSCRDLAAPCLGGGRQHGRRHHQGDHNCTGYSQPQRSGQSSGTHFLRPTTPWIQPAAEA